MRTPGNGGRGRSLVRAVVAFIVVAVLVPSAAVVAGPAGPAGALPPPPVPLAFAGARMDAATWTARQDAYLAYATAAPMSNGSINSIIANAERHRRDPSHPFDGTAPQPSDFAGLFQKLSEYRDTGDFDIADILRLWYGYRDELDPGLVTAFEQRLLAFKYWWTEPTPPGIVDSQYYWTENHQALFLANEYLAGQAFPDRTFTNSGMTGAEHKAHAEPLLRRWLALRARYGFSEWLSNVYYGEDLTAMLLLAEWSDDPELARLAGMMTDLLFVEIASHLHEGAFGSTHGRSYMKDKMTARDEDIFSLDRLVFDQGPVGFDRVDVAVDFAVARRWRPSQAALNIAADDQVAVVRQRQSQPLDPHGPVTPNPTPPNGLPYDDLMVWWGLGAQFAWPVVPLSVATINAYDLWDTENFQQAAALRPIVEGSTIDQLQGLSAALGDQINPGLLSEAHTYTWRSPEAMLSTAQDWRPGQRSEQAHVWQATLDPDAQVFTTHPREPVPTTTNWYTNSGYWTGEGAAPRAGQVANVNISIYSPQYDSADTGPLAALGYQPFTHAYFPAEKFDQVVQTGNWTIGRKGNGYVALWSWRATQWRAYDPSTEPTNGMTDFDLVAPGGPDNVWVTEVGRAADWSGAPDPFAAFVAAVSAATPQVTPRTPPGVGHSARDGFDVTYASPTTGTVQFGWTGPMTVNGNPVELHEPARWSSPWANVAFDSLRYPVTAGGATLDLDFSSLAQTTPSSTTTAPPTTPAPVAPGPATPNTATPAPAAVARPRFTG